MLRDAAGTEVASGDGADGVLRVEGAHLWAPGDGYLYDLEVQLVDGDETVSAAVGASSSSARRSTTATAPPATSARQAAARSK